MFGLTLIRTKTLEARNKKWLDMVHEMADSQIEDGTRLAQKEEMIETLTEKNKDTFLKKEEALRNLADLEKGWQRLLNIPISMKSYGHQATWQVMLELPLHDSKGNEYGAKTANEILNIYWEPRANFWYELHRSGGKLYARANLLRLPLPSEIEALYSHFSNKVISILDKYEKTSKLAKIIGKE